MQKAANAAFKIFFLYDIEFPHLKWRDVMTNPTFTIALITTRVNCAKCRIKIACHFLRPVHQSFAYLLYRRIIRKIPHDL